MSGQISTTTPYSRVTQAKRAAARSILYRLLSLGFLYPEPESLALLRSNLEEAEGYLKFLGYIQALPTLRQAREALPPTFEDLERSYVEAFGHALSTDCPPCELEYHQAHIFQKTQSLADVAGFYNAYGLEVGPQAKERPDHLSLELEFMHFLAWKEAYALEQGHGKEKVDLCRQAQQTFLQEHLGWVPLFAQRLTLKVENGFMAAWGRLAKDFVASEAQALGVSLSEPAQGVPPEEAWGEDCASCSFDEADEEGGGEP